MAKLIESALNGNIENLIEILNRDANLVNYANEVVLIFFQLSYYLKILYINSLLYYFYIFDQNGHTALHCAAYNGDTSAISLLIDKGADINKKDAVKKYNIYLYDIILTYLLINILCYFYIFDQIGRTAYNWAYARCQTSAMTLLIDKGANINIHNNVI